MVGPSAFSLLTGLQMFEDASLGQAGLQRNRQRHSGQQTDLGTDGQTHAHTHIHTNRQLK